MIYCDIHTHRTPLVSDNFVIVNKIVGIKQSQCFLPGNYYSYGIHPWNIENKELQFGLLTEAAFHPSVIALGEAGLDKNIETPLQEQTDIFTRQAVLAEEFGKPLIIHCVKAWDEMLAVKKELKPRMPWIIHGFRGNGILAEQLVNKGFWLSFGEKHNPEALKAAWPNKLLTETDESAIGIENIYIHIARNLEVPIDLLALTLSRNVKEVFSI